jgi:cytochrome c oxidase subunit 4
MSDHSHDSEGHIGHVLPLSLLLKVFGALVALTILTVMTGKADLHGADLAVAMIIATCKASLVCLFFMHLKYDRPFHGLIFLFSVMFVGLFLVFVTLDSEEYQGDIKDYKANEVLELQVGE